MVGSLHALLHQGFDDAGLFPPTALPLVEAALRHQVARQSPTAPYIRRFVIPVNWLPELGAWLKQQTIDPDRPWQLSVLGTSLEGFRQDLLAIERFEALVEDRALVDAYEVKAAPEDVTLGALRAVANAGFEDAYVELPWGPGVDTAWQTLAESEVVGAKARMGGLEAAAFPSGDAVATFLREMVSVDVPFKLTAGLHEPFPHRDERTGAMAHGFLNVLVAGVLATAHDLTTQEIVRILSETDPTAFWFTDGGLGWVDLEADLEEIAEFRVLFGGIGTCSLDEPLAGLRRLNLFA